MRSLEGIPAQFARWIVVRKRKTTVLVEEQLLGQVRRLVGKGGYRSLSTCVNEALRVFLAQERRRRLEAEMEEASRDEMFFADIQSTMEDFKYADAETARRMEKR
jgi:Arc/MetJ-type ribon-helix-helix transcriptional regulator